MSILRDEGQVVALGRRGKEIETEGNPADRVEEVEGKGYW